MLDRALELFPNIFFSTVFLIAIVTLYLAVVQERRRAKNQKAMARAFVAIESGEAAGLHVEDFTSDPTVIALLNSRVAEQSGDYVSAERYYGQMLASPETEVLGRKGLMAAALKRGDRAGALAHALAALSLSKTAEWPFQSAFDLAVQAGDWETAMTALEAGEARKLIDFAVASRRRAVLMTAQAAEGKLDPDAATDLAMKAFRASPRFAPASVLAARLLAAKGKMEQASTILEEAWENDPHPALASAYRDLNPDELLEDRAARMSTLVDKRPDHRESRILVGELAMERGDWDAAQDAFGEAYRENPSSRICILFAQVARGRGDENAARTWLAQAAAAPREADWSDLDPAGGPAFQFGKDQWARLVHAYGDSGQLIHPNLDGTTASVPEMAPLAIGSSSSFDSEFGDDDDGVR